MDTNKGFGNKLTVALAVVTASVVGFVGNAFAAENEAIVDAATAGGTDMSDTMLAIAAALIPLAIGVWIARKAWKIIRGFF